MKNLLSSPKQNYYQQGDTLYFLVDELPENMKRLETNVIQEGESTGHAHRIHEGEFSLWEDSSTMTKFLEIVTQASLKHEEHNEVLLPPGKYRVGIVREYDHFKEEARRVAD